MKKKEWTVRGGGGGIEVECREMEKRWDNNNNNEDLRHESNWPCWACICLCVARFQIIPLIQEFDGYLGILGYFDTPVYSWARISWNYILGLELMHGLTYLFVRII